MLNRVPIGQRISMATPLLYIIYLVESPDITPKCRSPLWQVAVREWYCLSWCSRVSMCIMFWDLVYLFHIDKTIRKEFTSHIEIRHYGYTFRFVIPIDRMYSHLNVVTCSFTPVLPMLWLQSFRLGSLTHVSLVWSHIVQSAHDIRLSV
jgi:hypothetical protein